MSGCEAARGAFGTHPNTVVDYVKTANPIGDRKFDRCRAGLRMTNAVRKQYTNHTENDEVDRVSDRIIDVGGDRDAERLAVKTANRLTESRRGVLQTGHHAVELFARRRLRELDDLLAGHQHVLK